MDQWQWGEGLGWDEMRLKVGKSGPLAIGAVWSGSDCYPKQIRPFIFRSCFEHVWLLPKPEKNSCLP